MSLSSPEERLTDEERQLIAANQLGALLHVYRVKTGFLRFYRGMSVFFAMMAILTMAFVFWGLSRHGAWPSALQPETDLPLAPLLMPPLFALVGVVLTHRATSRLSHTRVMLFEHGLLLRQHQAGRRRTDVLRWEQMTHLVPERGLILSRCVLWGRGGKQIQLESTFQDFDALITEVQRQKEKRNG